MRKQRRKNFHFLLPHQRVIDNCSKPPFRRSRLFDNFYSCETFTRLLSRNFFDDGQWGIRSSINNRKLAESKISSLYNNVNFQNSDQFSCANISLRQQQHHHQQSQQSAANSSTPCPLPRKRADTFHGTPSLTVAAALNNINLSSLGPLCTSPTPTKDSSNSSNRVSRAPSPATGASDNRSKFTTTQNRISFCSFH